MRQIKRDGRLPQDKMTTLAAILFIPAIIIFALVYKGLSGWRADIQYEKDRVEREIFVKNIYAPLTTAQKSLILEFSNMRKLLQEIETMEHQYPNHAELIREIRSKWRLGQRDLYDVYSETDKEIRFAWIAHNRLDQRDVLVKFSKTAVQLESKIKKAENDYRLSIREARGDLVRNIDNARHLLNSYRRPPKSKKQDKANQALREKINPFTDRAKANLLSYLSSVDGRLGEQLEFLITLIQNSGQQSAILDEHLLKNPDLEKPLTLIINEWKNLEANSQTLLLHILYSIEAEFVAVKLGLLSKNPAIQSMHKSLRLIIPEMVGKGIKQKKVIERSYKVAF